MNVQELIGKRIASVRKQRHLKQVDLGAAIGVTDQTISNWEVGLRTPRSDLLYRLCVELNCSADYILGITNDSPYTEDDANESSSRFED